MLIVRASHYGFYTREMMLFGGFIQAFFFWIGRFIYVKSATGHWWNWENSGFRDHKTDKFKWRAVLAIMLDVVIKIVSGWMVILSFKYALYAGVNQGAITTLFTLTGIYVAIISWFMFDEKLNRFHIIGMGLLVGCTVLIVFSKQASSENKIQVYSDEVPEISPTVPVGFALLTSLIYSIRTIYVKLFVRKLKFHSFDYMAYSYLISGGIFIPFAVESIISREDVPYEVTVLGICSGCINCCASFFLFHATTTGVTGPAYALKNLEPILQTVIGTLFLGLHLNVSQVLAIAMGIIGSLTITIGPYIFKSKEQIKEEKMLLEKARLKGL